MSPHITGRPLQAPQPATMSSDLQPQPRGAAPTLLDMPAGVLQHIMALALQGRHEPCLLPRVSDTRCSSGGAVVRR